MLITIFRFFDAHPAAYWTLAFAATGLMAAWIAFCFTRRGRNLSSLTHAIAAGATLLIVLLAWRWPPLFGIEELNPDESQLLAGALTLKQDPVFWRSVDGTTSGPLNFYVLLPIHWVGVPLDYFTARLTGLLLVWGTLWSLYALLRREYAPGVVLLGITPGLAMLATMIDRDFIHYSSEHLSILPIMLSAWLLWASHRDAPTGRAYPRISWLAAGFLMGMLPWAKLQSAPIAATLAAWGTLLALSRTDLPWRARWKEIAVLAVAALTTSVFFLGSILAYGLWEHFYKCYIENNLIYASSPFTLRDSILKLNMLSAMTGSFHAFIAGPLFALAGGVIAFLLRPRLPNALFWPGLILTVVSVIAVITPRQGFQHYLLYVIPTLTWLGAVAFADLRRAMEVPQKRLALGLAFALIGAGLIIANRVRLGHGEMTGHLVESWENPFSEQAKLIRGLKQPGDRLAVWGWDCQVYVETRLPQATREAHSARQMWDSSQRETYYRPRYMADLKANAPAFFMDATGKDAFFFVDRGRWRHENFEDLMIFVSEHYTLLEDFGRSRVYVRNDRLSRHE